MRSALSLLFSLGVVAAVWPSNATACSCGTSDPHEAFDRAVVVFAGEVVSIHERQVAMVRSRPTRQPGYDVVFELIELWKGDVDSSIALFTGVGDGDCGYRFRRGQHRRKPLTALKHEPSSKVIKLIVAAAVSHDVRDRPEVPTIRLFQLLVEQFLKSTDCPRTKTLKMLNQSLNTFCKPMVRSQVATRFRIVNM